MLSSVRSRLLTYSGFRVDITFVAVKNVAPLLRALGRLRGGNVPKRVLAAGCLGFDRPGTLRGLRNLSGVALGVCSIRGATRNFRAGKCVFGGRRVCQVVVKDSGVADTTLADGER